MTAAPVGPMRPGDVVYLVPTLPTAPRAAYRMPRCTVVQISGPRVTVNVDGREIETDARNVKRRRPDLGRTREPRAPRKPSMPDGYAEVTLW